MREREQINNTLQNIVDTITEPWGIKIEMVEMKDVEIPEAMQRAMAREAEAIRENGHVSLRQKQSWKHQLN